jgi:hypothetical protein
MRGLPSPCRRRLQSIAGIDKFANWENLPQALLMSGSGGTIEIPEEMKSVLPAKVDQLYKW